MTHHEAFSAGNTAVITGAADGIGRAAAERYASFGMNLVVADINEDRLAETVAAIRANGAGADVEIATVAVDVARLDQVMALKANAFERFGRVDVLMNNAGTSAPSGSYTELDAWHRVIDVNLWGIVHGVHAFAQAMIDQRRPGLIINTGSKQGITNPPGNPAYNVSKAAVKAATEALQHELRNTPDCAVSAHLLVPGYTYTGMTRRRVTEKPPGAWLPDQVIDYMLEAIARGSFYIICPDNEVSTTEDMRRISWAAGDIARDRPPLSRWHGDYAEAFKKFVPDLD